MYLEREALGTKQLLLEVYGSWLRQSADLTPQGLWVSPCWFQVGPCRPWGPGGLPRSGSGLEARFARRWAGAPLRVWILLGDQILLGGHCGKDCAPWGSSVLRGVSGGPQAPLL